MDTRSEAARAVTQSVRTGEAPAGNIAASHLADDVVLKLGSTETKGKNAVVKLITGIWPNTAVYTQGFWSAPTPENGSLIVSADFPPLGAAPKSAKLTFDFNAQDKISHIAMEVTPQAPPTPTD